MESIALVVCFFTFLFTLYGLSKDDFILLRKNISMDQVFNISIIAMIVGLFFARALYVANHFTVSFLNPLVFLALPYFPGISIVGGVIGFVVFILYFASVQKVPTQRLFDFSTVSLLVAMGAGYVLQIALHLIRKKPLPLLEYITPLVLLVLTLVFFFLLLPRYRRGEMKDAHLGLVFLACFFASTLLTDILENGKKLLIVMGVEGLLSLGILIFALSLLLKKERKVIRFSKIRI